MKKDASFDPKGAAAAAMAASRPATPGGDEPVFLTERLLAERWHLSPRTLQRWRRDGRGPDHVVISKRVLFPLAGILAFERRHLRHGGVS